MQAIVSDRRIRVTKNIEPMASQQALTKTCQESLLAFITSKKTFAHYVNGIYNSMKHRVYPSHIRSSSKVFPKLDLNEIWARGSWVNSAFNNMYVWQFWPW